MQTLSPRHSEILLRRWVSAGWGAADATVWHALAAHLPRDSAAYGAAAARARGLFRELA